MRPSWFIDELVFAGRENLDAEHVEHYDAKEDAGAAAEVARACARGRGRRVPAVLDQLRAKVADRGLDNAELVRAGLLSYEHAGPPADFVYSRLALHHIPDFWKAMALEGLRRTLRPGGIVRLVDVATPG